MRLILGISGATGPIYGIRLLEVLKEKGIETHLVITPMSEKIIPEETSYSVKEVEHLATFVHENEDLGAPISSGSFKMDGMVIIPCSIKSLSVLVFPTMKISDKGSRCHLKRGGGLFWSS
jgi:4-hydroxy-3-polyprenylbenzoate decarboxylase